jgi:DNA-3-methyladenine glycosylase
MSTPRSATADRPVSGYVPSESAVGEEDPGASPDQVEAGPEIDFTAPADIVAHALIGATLLVNGVGGVIVETEAYDCEDPASHSFGGPTPRNGSMFGPPGHAYVYRSYGLHWCLNLVCMPAGHGAGVLIRALAPTAGLALMRARRGIENPLLLCSGPGRVCQALGVTREHDGQPINAPPFVLLPKARRAEVLVGPRIGISRAVDVPWRFGLAGSRFVSRSFR